MGLKNKLSKMKNFLFDEEEVESPKKKKNNKKNQAVESEPEETVNYDDLYLNDISDADQDETIEVKSRVAEKERDFKIPEFNDDDFMIPNNSPIKKEPVIEEVEEKRPLYQGSKRKEETKRFKPSPIISPIYGLLDKDGNEISKSEINSKSNQVGDTTFDKVRNKAYGKALDDEIDNTISRLSKKTIGEAEAEYREIRSRVSDKKKTKSYDKEEEVFNTINFGEIDVDKQANIKKKAKEASKEMEEDEEDTKEQDLFNLIDTIYSNEGSDNK